MHYTCRYETSKQAIESFADLARRVAEAQPIADMFFAYGLPLCGESDGHGNINAEVFGLAGDPLHLDKHGAEHDPHDVCDEVDQYVQAALVVGIAIGLRLRPEAFMVSR